MTAADQKPEFTFSRTLDPIVQSRPDIWDVYAADGVHRPGGTAGRTPEECYAHRQVAVHSRRVQKRPEFKKARTVLLMYDRIASQLDTECRHARKETYFLDAMEQRVVRADYAVHLEPQIIAADLGGAPSTRALTDLPHFDLVISGCHAFDREGRVFSAKPAATFMDLLRVIGRIDERTAKMVLVSVGKQTLLTEKQPAGMTILMHADIAVMELSGTHAFRDGPYGHGPRRNPSR